MKNSAPVILGESIAFNLGRGDEIVSTTEEAIAVLWRLKERYSDRSYFDPAVASMRAADQSGAHADIRKAINDYKMFIYNTF